MWSDSRISKTKRILSDFAINPRGELWKKAGQNYGNKLMKKMGWKQGDGLGKTNSGITEPIRVVQTYDNEGLGYSKQVVDYSWNWLSHHDDYDVLLAKLQEQYSESVESCTSDNSSSSCGVPRAVDLEKKSKGSRNRVHYQRAIQGKNMSNRSQADWQCILGTRKKRKKETLEDSDEKLSGDEMGSKTLFITSTMSSHTYFMKKRQKLEETGPTENDSGEQVVPEEHVPLSENSLLDEAEQMSLTSCFRKPKKKKRKKKRKNEGPELQGKDDAEDEDSPPLQSEDEQSTKNKENRIEKENRFAAEDSLIVFKKAKKKKKKKKRKGLQDAFQTIADLTNIQGDDVVMNTSTSLFAAGTCDGLGSSQNGAVDLYTGILKTKPASPSLQRPCEKKRVRFVDKPLVGYVPGKDSVRGGAWVWLSRRS